MRCSFRRTRAGDMNVWLSGKLHGGRHNASVTPCLWIEWLVYFPTTADRAPTPELATDLDSGPPAARTATSVNRIFPHQTVRCLASVQKVPSVSRQNWTSFVYGL